MCLEDGEGWVAQPCLCLHLRCWFRARVVLKCGGVGQDHLFVFDHEGWVIHERLIESESEQGRHSLRSVNHLSLQLDDSTFGSVAEPRELTAGLGF